MLRFRGRSLRFVTECVWMSGAWGPQQNLASYVSAGPLRWWLHCQSPQVQAESSLMQALLLELDNSLRQLNQAVKAVCSQSSCISSEVMLVEEDLSAGYGCLCTVVYLCWQTFVVWTLRKHGTDEGDDVGIVPSAQYFCQSVTGLVLTVKYHTLVADSNRAYLNSYDLISLRPWFYWVTVKVFEDLFACISVISVLQFCQKQHF